MGPLSGVGIVIANIAGNNDQVVRDVASNLGASILRPEHSQQATYLVASNVLPVGNSDPYLVAVQHNPRLAIVDPNWILQCQATQRKVPHDPYILQPLAGVWASVTNFGARDRATVTDQIASGGARTSPELLRQMTHLVGKNSGGNKYTHAKDWGLFVVHLNWVLDSIKAGHRLDESLYHLDKFPPANKAALSGPSAQGANGERQPAEVGAPGPGGAPPSAVAAAPGAGGLRRNGSGALPPANGATAPKGGPAAAAPGARDRDPQQPPPGGSGNLGNQYYLIPAVPPDDCFFLHWVRLWLVGCTPSEMSHVLAAVRESGATREPVLGGDVTHIVLGSVLSTADLAAVQQHLGGHREQVKLARLGWLYECVNRRSYVEPEGPYTVTIPQLLGQGGAGPGGMGPSQVGRGAGHRSREPSPAAFAGGPAGVPAAAVVGGQAGPAGGRSVAPLDDYVPLEPEANTRTMDSLPRAPPGVFTGLWFTLVAVAGMPDENTATKLIRQGGGMIMSSSTEKDVRDAARRFAVCPFSLPQPAVDRLCTRGRDRFPTEFERVVPEQRVTVDWLRACLDSGKLVQYSRDTPLWRPIPHAVPLPGFPGLLIASSQYAVDQREVLQQLVTRLGAEHTENFNKRCHYLIISVAEGKKFECALKWGIPCVNHKWLVESALAGRLLDPQLPAFLPAGITQAEMEEKRGNRGVGRGCAGGASQLGPTQRPQGPVASQLPGAMPMRGAQGPTQQELEGRPEVGPPGLPPRPTQAGDRRGAPPQGLGGTQAPPVPLHPRRGPLVPGAPATAAHLAPDAAAPRADDVPPTAAAPAGALQAKPSSGMQPLLRAILEEENSETEAGATPARRACPSDGRPGGAPADAGAAATAPPGPSTAAPPQASNNPPCSSASAQAPGSAPADPPGHPGEAVAAPAAGEGMGTAGPGTAGTGTSAAGVGPEPKPSQPARPPPPPPAPPAAAVHVAQLGAAAAEHGAAAASLMQFLSSNQIVPDMMCSQMDMPLPMPLPESLPGTGHPGAEGSLTGAEASRQLGTMKAPEGEGAGGAGAGRRSRKRNAAAAVGEAQGLPGKVGGLPGRRGRSAEEEEGFGVAMSQQVGYAAEAAALPPRTTRSQSRGRGGLGNDAKQNLIKAVQGNMR